MSEVIAPERPRDGHRAPKYHRAHGKCARRIERGIAFASAKEARAHGYRECRVCQPDFYEVQKGPKHWRTKP